VRDAPDAFLKCNLMTRLIAHDYQLFAMQGGDLQVKRVAYGKGMERELKKTYICGGERVVTSGE